MSQVGNFCNMHNNEGLIFAAPTREEMQDPSFQKYLDSTVLNFQEVKEAAFREMSQHGYADLKELQSDLERDVERLEKHRNAAAEKFNKALGSARLHLYERYCKLHRKHLEVKFRSEVLDGMLCFYRAKGRWPTDVADALSWDMREEAGWFSDESLPNYFGSTEEEIKSWLRLVLLQKEHYEVDNITQVFAEVDRQRGTAYDSITRNSSSYRSLKRFYEGSDRDWPEGLEGWERELGLR